MKSKIECKLKRTRTYCCPYHDLWGTKEELLAHHKENHKNCKMCQELEVQ